MKNTCTYSNISGHVHIPSSKSYAQRAVFCASLSAGRSVIRNYTVSDDGEAALDAVQQLGAIVIRKTGGELHITGSLDFNSDCVFARESGLSSRILSALLILSGRRIVLEGSKSLLKRSFRPMFSVYNQMQLKYSSKDSFLPLQIEGHPSLDRDIVIDGSMSSQYITGLLMALAWANFDRILIIENPKSLPYIEMTLDILQEFGVTWKPLGNWNYKLLSQSRYRATHYNIEGDWSSAAMLMVAAKIAGTITLSGLHLNSKQADLKIKDIISHTERDGQIHIEKGPISAFRFDAEHCPDLFPPLVALASHANGISEISGVSRLYDKESDRAKSLCLEFEKIGTKIELSGNKMLVHPGPFRHAEVSSHGDHRIAMALSITALGMNKNVVVDSTECVAKSYPKFYEDLVSLGANIKSENQ